MPAASRIRVAVAIAVAAAAVRGCGASTAVPALGAAARRVVISGHVVDEHGGAVVGGVAVVFRDAGGEATTTTHSDGRYQIALAASVYEAYVRDDFVQTVGEGGGPRLAASTDLRGIDIPVLRTGVLEGQVVDPSGQPVVGALVRATGFQRPVLATNVAVTDGDGRFAMHVPMDSYALHMADARDGMLTTKVLRLQLDTNGASDHGAGQAEVEHRNDIPVEPGGVTSVLATLEPGCVISGRVIRADGGAVTGGVIQGDGGATPSYGPHPHEWHWLVTELTGSSFQWVTGEHDEIKLRAVPWGAAPSPVQTFRCAAGARFSEVVFVAPAAVPGVAGVVVDAHGAPVRDAEVEAALADDDAGDERRGEWTDRTDANGRWALYDLPPADVAITVTSVRGDAAAQLTAPMPGPVPLVVRTRRLVGTTSELVDGSFVAEVAGRQQLVPVAGGAFAIEEIPASEGEIQVRWRGHVRDLPADVSGRVATRIGPLHDKLVSGVVRDARGRPVAGVRVTCERPDLTIDSRREDSAETTTDRDGAYGVFAWSGATVTAVDDGAATPAPVSIAIATVSYAPTGVEHVDLTLAPIPQGEP